MNNDELIAKIADVIRAEEKEADEKLDTFAAGQLDEAGVRRGLGARPDADALVAAYRPLGDAARAAIVEQLVALAREGRGVGARRRVLRFLGRPRVGASVAFAVAAGLAAVFLWPALPPLPVYGERFVAGDVAQRGAGAEPPAEVPRLRADTRLEWLLRPERAVEGPVKVAAYIGSEDRMRPWPVDFEVSVEGAARLVGTPWELSIPAGEVTLVVMLGRPAALSQVAPTSLDDARQVAERSDVSVFMRRVVVEP